LAGTVTLAGTTTAESLLERATATPPLCAAPLRVTVQASVPAPVIEDCAQEIALNAADTPAALISMVRLPADELLVIVTIPVKLLTCGEVKPRFRIAVWPGFSVKGVVTPVAENSDPATEMPEIVTGALPVEDRVTLCETVCPTAMLPKLIVDALTASTGLAAIPAALISMVRLPADELLVIVTMPVKLLTCGEVNPRFSVAVWPGFSVSGVVTPVAENNDPATEMPEIVTGALPVDDSVTLCETV
jgi:hypothetical protein